MAFWNRKKEQREQPVITVNDILAGIVSKSEITVEQALNVPGLSSCVDFISQKVAELPVKLYRETADNKTEEVKYDNRVSLLNDDTGDLPDCFQLKQAVIRDMLLCGTGYIFPERKRNDVVSLRYVDRKYVAYNINSDPIFKKADYIINGRVYRDDELIRVCRNTKNGVYGTGFVEEHNQILTVAYKSLIYEKYLVATGGNKKGFLKSSHRLDKEGIEIIKNQWNELHNNTGSTMMVLNEGLDFKESSNTSVEMQLQENKRTNNELICQLFGLSSDVLSGKANDEQYVNAIKIAVVPVAAAFQTALNKGLLLPSERRNMYFVLDMTELLKGDILKRYQAYQIGLSSSFLQPDEVRYKEDLEPLGFKWIKLGLNDVLLDTKDGTIYTPNTNQMVKIGEQADLSDFDIDDENIPTDTEKRWDGQRRESNGQFGKGKKTHSAQFKNKKNSDKSPKNFDKKGKSDKINSNSSKVQNTSVDLSKISAKGRNEFTIKGFKSKQVLNNHFEKHKNEYVVDGITTAEQYEKRALELVQSSCNENILGYKNKHGQVIRCDIVKKEILKKVFLQCLSRKKAVSILMSNLKRRRE